MSAGGGGGVVVVIKEAMEEWNEKVKRRKPCGSKKK